MTPPPHMDAYIRFVQQVLGETGPLIMGYFRSGLAVEDKADHTPVTLADREAETLLRQRIQATFPTHQVLGEEYGLTGPSQAELQWVLDPIDGTKAFIHGVPLFGTLLALLHQGQPILGAIHLPALGELLLGAQGHPTTLNGQPVRVSTTSRLEDATLLLTSPSTLFDMGLGDAFHNLRKRVKLVRCWGDCYGHFLVATGRADIMLDPVMNLWDVAPMKPILEGAGGKHTDMAGNPSGVSTSALSTNGLLHPHVLEILPPT